MDVPHCQAAKDVLADAAAWPACQAPGLQAARETRDGVEEEGKWEGGERTDGAEIWQGDFVGERRIRYEHGVKQRKNSRKNK